LPLTPGGRRYARQEAAWQRSPARTALLRRANGPASRKCAVCKGKGRLQGGGRCPVCKGKGRVASSFAASLVGGGVGLVNQGVEGGGGAASSQGGGPTGGFNSGRHDLDLVRAKCIQRDAKAPLSRRADAYVHGSDPTPLGKYDRETVERLGKESKALQKRDGSFWFPLTAASDVDNCVAAYRALEATERDGVRAWITLRCRLLNLSHMLPQGWDEYSGKLHPRETEVGPDV
jgi:hypothetical protein